MTCRHHEEGFCRMNKRVSTKESVDALNPGAGDLPVLFGLHEKIPAGSLRLNVATKKGCAIWVSTCSLRSETRCRHKLYKHANAYETESANSITKWI